MASEIKVDTISEKTSAGGVTIDGLLIKDGGISGDVSLIGTTPTFTIGDAGAEDAALVFDGNAQDFYIALDDSADDLVIGLGSTVGTTPAISINSDRDVTISDGAIDFDIASHDTSNGLKLGGTLVTATAAELNIMDGVTSTAAEINLIDGGTSRGTTAVASGDGILINDAGTMRMTNVDTVSTYFAGHSVGGTNIATVGTIGTGTWQGTAIASSYIAADAITGAKIADDAIDSEHYTDGSIDNAHIADDAIDSEHYAAGSIDTAHIADDQISLAKMAGLARGKIIYGDSSGDPAALAVGSADQVLTHDGTDVSWADAGGGVNTPAFQAKLNSAQAISYNSYQKITVDTELFDSDSKFASNRFTPTTAGKYFLYAMQRWQDDLAYDARLAIYKNGSLLCETEKQDPRHDGQAITTIVDSDSDDYFEIYAFQGRSGSSPTNLERDTFFGGFKLIT